MTPQIKMMKIMWNPMYIRDSMKECQSAGQLFLVVGIPWFVIEKHEVRAMTNHNQSLERLNERGGVSIVEAYCILNNVSLFSTKISVAEANSWVYDYIRQHTPAQ